MTVQHIAMVFDAEGLTAPEKHLLLAYCNHTDAHGYCWPGIDRLADETGMSVRTVKRANVALKAKNLIRSVRRVNPKTGEPITNLTRVNIPLLDSMKRPARNYNDDLITEITFDGDDGQETASDLLMCQSDTDLVPNWHVGRGQNGTQTLSRNLTTSSSPDPSTARQSQPSHEEEEVGATPKGNPAQAAEGTVSPPAPTPTVPQPRPGDHDGDGEHQAAAGLVASLPGTLNAGETRRLINLTVAAIAAGWTVEDLRAELVRDLGNAWSRVAVWHDRLKPGNLGEPPAAPARRTAAAMPPWCGDCDEYDRTHETDEHQLYYCPRCNPLSPAYVLEGAGQ